MNYHIAKQSAPVEFYGPFNSEAEANAEAERLAKTEPGVGYLVLQALGTYTGCVCVTLRPASLPLDTTPELEDSAETLHVNPFKHPANLKAERVAFARRTLRGTAFELTSCFDWSASPQGDAFWRSQHEAGKLSPEGEALLRGWLAEVEHNPDKVPDCGEGYRFATKAEAALKVSPDLPWEYYDEADSAFHPTTLGGKLGLASTWSYRTKL